MSATDDVLSVNELAGISIAASFSRMSDALEAANKPSAEVKSIAASLASIAESHSTLVNILASLVGRGSSVCPPPAHPDNFGASDVLYLRTGDGRQPFGCDESIED